MPPAFVTAAANSGPAALFVFCQIFVNCKGRGTPKRTKQKKIGEIKEQLSSRTHSSLYRGIEGNRGEYGVIIKKSKKLESTHTQTHKECVALPANMIGCWMLNKSFQKWSQNPQVSDAATALETSFVLASLPSRAAIREWVRKLGFGGI
jgi:hypothetical protein